MESDFVVIVSGLPRSGTSMMMRALEAGGMPVLADHIRKPDEDNPRGYFEFEPVKKTKEDPSWLQQAPGKAVKMVYRLLYDLPAGYQYRVLFMQRNIQEVLASQRKMLLRVGKSVTPEEDAQMAVLFESELARCRQWLARQPHFSVFYVDYRAMIENPLAQSQQISEFLGGGLNVQAMSASVDPALYRNRHLSA